MLNLHNFQAAIKSTRLKLPFCAIPSLDWRIGIRYI